MRRIGLFEISVLIPLDIQSALSLSPTTGEVPSVSAGSVDATGCITRDRECCVAELPLRVRNCSSFVVYRLEPTPGCNMGYCVGDGVPCPKGLNSESGYTPCECESVSDLPLRFENCSAHYCG